MATPARSFTSLLHRDQSGATIVEFALVLPVLLVMLMGMFDAGMTLYATSVLQGAMQEAGRAFSLEDSRSRQAEMEDFISQQMTTVAPHSELVFERRAYFDFSDVRQPEIFDDINGDGECNYNEPFEDVNGNGTWDEDRGENGFGGARDAVLFTATVTFPRLFPMNGLLGFDDEVTLEASTVLRNQPFDDQDRSFPMGQCSR